MGVLTRAVSSIRQALGDDPKAPRYLETIPRKGYRLIAAISPTRIDTIASPRRPNWVLLALASIVLIVVGVIAWIGFTAKTPTEIAVKSVGVLPFEAIGSSPEHAMLAAALGEAVLSELGRLHGLRVISGAGSADNSLEVAQELGVDAILRGMVAPSADAVRVNLVLIEGVSGHVMWSDGIERPATDLLALQGEIARAVAEAAKLKLAPEARERLAGATGVDPTAVREVLFGRHDLARRTPESLLEAASRFEIAVGKSPEWAPAWSGLSDAMVLLAAYGPVPPREALLRARDAAERAVELDSGLAEARASLGIVRLNLDWDLEGASLELRAAIRLAPSYAAAHLWYSECLSMLGSHQEAISAGRFALSLDPLSPILAAALGQRFNQAGRFEEALAQFDRARKLGAAIAWIHRERAIAFERLDRVEEATQARRLEMSLRNLSADDLRELDIALDLDGLSGFWRWQLDRLVTSQEQGVVVPASHLAEARSANGEIEGAVADLERARAESAQVLFLIQHSPAFDGLREQKLWPIE